MANLDMNFDLLKPVSMNQGNQIKKALKEQEGINYVDINYRENKVSVGYTPGIINIQTIKEEIENQGIDVSDLN